MDFKYRTSERTGKQHVLQLGKNSGVKSGVHIWHLGNRSQCSEAMRVALFQILPALPSIWRSLRSGKCIGAGKHDQAQYYTKN